MADDDLRETLPDPPPASPSRREAAIEEAMRRFDGKPPSRTPKPARPDREGWIRRPQFGALVTVGLMAVIGVPAAWLAVEHHDGEEPSSPAPVVRDLAAASNSAAPAVARRDSAPTMVASAEPAGPAPAAESKPQGKAAAQEQARTGDRYANLRVAPMVQPPAMIAPAIVAAPASPPPPQPPAAVAEAAPSASYLARASAADSVVVTGLRFSTRRAEQGDWNSCTIDDPRRDLPLCSQSLGAAETGVNGTAAAHIADGISRAWRDDMAGAIQSFDAAIAIAPKSGDAYLNRSLAFSHLGDMDRALGDANKAVRHSPHEARTFYNRSLLLRRQGKVAKAKEDEQRAVALDPSYSAVIAKQP